ncbi:MAG TPA: DnaB-like helicase C-terminal domain-containing protein [Salinarimonas sp.]|nr:DnaB-like helicase C-terminal domain-containing protein [Salinarimonas sp.]
MTAADAVPEAERCLLGSVFLRPELAGVVELAEGDFYDWKHREVWRAMQELHASRRPANDIALLAEAIGSRMPAVGGLSFLSDLMASHVTPDNYEHYVRLVTEASLTRRVRSAVAELLASDAKGEELVSKAFESISGLLNRTSDGAVTIGDAVREKLAEITQKLEAKERGEVVAMGIPTGLPKLDEVLGGLQTGVVTIVAGRPSMGKSSLARTLADNVNRQGYGVHVFSLEHKTDAYTTRALADAARIELGRLRAIDIDRHEYARLLGAGDKLSGRRGWIIDSTSNLSAVQVAMRVRRHRRENGTRMVVVDYVQLLRDRRVRAGERKAMVDVAIEGLVELARSEDLALVVLSQLSRDCEKRDDKRPEMSDLRESGELEQVADSVLLLYRDEVYHKDSKDKGVGEVLIAKNKHGRTGRVRFAWDADTATYRELDWRSR